MSQIDKAILDKLRQASLECEAAATTLRFKIVNPTMLKMSATDQAGFERIAKAQFAILRRHFNRWDKTATVGVLRFLEEIAADPDRSFKVDHHTFAIAHRAAAYCAERLLNIVKVGCTCPDNWSECRALLEAVREVRPWNSSAIRAAVSAEHGRAVRELTRVSANVESPSPTRNSAGAGDDLRKALLAAIDTTKKVRDDDTVEHAKPDAIIKCVKRKRSVVRNELRALERDKLYTGFTRARPKRFKKQADRSIVPER